MPTPIPDLIARLNDVDESDDIEAKRSSTELGRSAVETISAFANEPGLDGGYLVFGLHEDAATRQFHVVGVKDPKKLEQEISSDLHQQPRNSQWFVPSYWQYRPALH